MGRGTPPTRELRELVRHRAKLVSLRSHCKAEVHAVLAKCGVQVLMSDLFAIPFTAVATDLLARKPVWFQQGSLELAIRASIAIPGFFTPVVLDGRVLVDGGVIDPVPMTPLASVRSDITIAVTLSGYPGESTSGVATSGAQESRRAANVGRLPGGLGSLLARDAASSAREPIAEGQRPETFVGSLTGRGVSGVGDSDESVDLKALEIVNLSYEAMSNVITRYRLAGYPPDVTVSVPQDACGLLDFHRAADMIDLGRRLADATLDRVVSVPPRRSV